MTKEENAVLVCEDRIIIGELTTEEAELITDAIIFWRDSAPGDPFPGVTGDQRLNAIAHFMINAVETDRYFSRLERERRQAGTKEACDSGKE